MRIIHFKEDPKTEKVEAEVLKSDDIDVTIKKDKMTEAAFKADSFSVYAIVYTVDFEYTDEETGEVYQYSMDGGKSMKLSELFKATGIKKDVKDVANVTFSDTSLVAVTKNDLMGDWVLQSLKAFDSQESLTIAMKDGDVITVKVTDCPLSQVPPEEARRETHTFTVASLRLDAVTGGLFRLSRTAAAEQIRLGLVQLNYEPCLRVDAEIREGDVISLRGKGKGTVTEIGGKSRKDRLFVTAERRI